MITFDENSLDTLVEEAAKRPESVPVVVPAEGALPNWFCDKCGRMFAPRSLEAHARDRHIARPEAQ